MTHQSSSPETEKQASDAPVWMSATAAGAWADGYNAALAALSRPSAGSATLWGQIAAIYGSLDAEDCAFVDREWARMRGYILPPDETLTLGAAQGAPKCAKCGDTGRVVITVDHCDYETVACQSCPAASPLSSTEGA